VESTLETYDLPNYLSRSNGIVKDHVDVIGVKVDLTVEVVKRFLKRCTYVGSNFVNAAQWLQRLKKHKE
jgi:hypothetical protein